MALLTREFIERERPIYARIAESASIEMTHADQICTQAALANDLLIDLLWIAEIADKNFEQDDGLRANGARTLKRISDRARAAIAKALQS